MSRPKQHYAFTFRNPGNDPSVTSWSDVVSKRSKNKDVDLSDIISVFKSENKTSAPDKISITHKFLTIVEALMGLK